MRPVVRTVVVTAVVLVALGAGLAGGWYLHPSNASNGGPSSETLAIVAAGSLAPILPSMASSFARATPGVDAPVAAELFEGSNAAASALTLPGQPYDLFVAADFRVVPQHLEPPAASVTDWEIVFASDPLVLAYVPGAAGLGGLNTTNWYEKIVDAPVTLGVPNASTDPLGANAIFALELEDGLTGASGALYGHFFSGGIGGFGTPTSATKIVAENVAATALATGEVSAYLVYRSYAEVNHLAFVVLNASVDVGGISPSDVAAYARADTTVLSGGAGVVEHATPVLFALTIPNDAPRYALGLAFAEYLLSNVSATTWAADGFVPLAPMWTDAPPHLPAALAGPAPGGVTALPSYLAALLG